MKNLFFLLALTQFCLAQSDKIIFAPESDHFNIYDANGKFLKSLNLSDPDSGEYNQNIIVDNAQRRIYLYGHSYGEVYSLNDLSFISKFNGQNDLDLNNSGKLMGFPIRETITFTYFPDIRLPDSIKIIHHYFSLNENKILLLINSIDNSVFIFNQIQEYDLYKNKVTRIIDLNHSYEYYDSKNLFDRTSNKFAVFDKDSSRFRIFDLSEMKELSPVNFTSLTKTRSPISPLRFLDNDLLFTVSTSDSVTYELIQSLYSFSFNTGLNKIADFSGFQGIIEFIEKGSSNTYYVGGNDLGKPDSMETGQSFYFIYKIDQQGNITNVLKGKGNYGSEGNRFALVKNHMETSEPSNNRIDTTSKIDLQIQKKIENDFAVFSDKGNYFITKGGNNELILWDSKNLLQIRTIPNIKVDFNTIISVSETKSEIGIAYDDESSYLRIFDLQNGKLKFEKKYEYGSIQWINLNTNSLLFKKYDDTYIENYLTGEKIKSFALNLSHITPDHTGKYFTALSDTKEPLKIFDYSGKEILSFNFPDSLKNNHLFELNFSTIDNYLMLEAYGSWDVFKQYSQKIIYNLYKHEQLTINTPSPVISDSFSSAYFTEFTYWDGTKNHFNITGINLISNKHTIIDSLDLMPGSNEFLALNPDNDRLYFFSNDRISYYNLKTNTILKSANKFLSSSYPKISIRQSDGKFIFNKNGYAAFDPANPLAIEDGFTAPDLYRSDDTYIAYDKNYKEEENNFTFSERFINSFDTTNYFDAEYRNQFVIDIYYSKLTNCLAVLLGNSSTEKNKYEVVFYNASAGQMLKKLNLENPDILKHNLIRFFNNGKSFSLKDNNTLLIYNTNDFSLTERINDVINFETIIDKPELVYIQDNLNDSQQYNYNIFLHTIGKSNEQLLTTIQSSSISGAELTITKNGRNAFILSDAGTLKKTYLKEEKLPEVFLINKNFTNGFGTDIQDRFLYQCLSDRINFYDINSLELKFSLFPTDDGNLVFVTSEGYYFNLKNRNNELFTFIKNNKAYPFEQFDLRFNRPDKVLETLGYASKETINIYRKAYEKRLRQLNIKEESLNNDFHMPEVVLNTNKLNVQTSERTIQLKFHAEDSKYLLNRINIYVNGVPVFGRKGKDISKSRKHESDFVENVLLNNGKNKIQVSVTNSSGVKSLQETAEVEYTGKPANPDLYLIAVSVSDYLDKNRNLKYSVKDGRDFINIYSNEKNLYGNNFIDSLFNQNATKDNFLKIKEQLKNSKVDDQVIVFFSGHGLLDNNYDFYYATYDIDFKNPSAKGLSYQEIDGLFNGIPARKKLLLVDACHSGDVDKDEIEVSDSSITLANGSKGDLKTYTYKSIETIDDESLRLNNSFDLMQELFANINKGNGTFVISAAAGSSFALESDEWKNGVFTYSIKDGLLHSAADLNNDKIITVNELKKFVGTEVEKLTKGFQKPTTRTENTDFDFTIYKED